MSTSGRNGAVEFNVIYSQAVLQALKRLLNGLSSEDERRRCAAALRVIHKRLRHDPQVFGEPRFTQSGDPHTVRIGGVLPLIVRFAVYEKRRDVWILGFHMLAP
ncbi:MAG TPA: hypothetical protein DDY78_07915 [Planctomycetales bacterium]|nr:hypothetical protein [Planctomycetales bacterium]